MKEDKDRAELSALQNKWAMGQASLAEIRRCRNLERRFSAPEFHRCTCGIMSGDCTCASRPPTGGAK